MRDGIQGRAGTYNQKLESRHQPPKWSSGNSTNRLPWSSGHDFRLSLKPSSAGDRGSIPRGRDFFFVIFVPVHA